MFRCMLHHLQWDHCITCSKTIAFCNVAIKCKIYTFFSFKFTMLLQCLKRRMHNVESFKIIGAQEAKLINNYRNTKNKLLKTYSSIWYNKIRRNSQLTPKRRNTYCVKHCNSKVSLKKKTRYIAHFMATLHTAYSFWASNSMVSLEMM